MVEDNNVVTEVLRGEDLSGLALESASSPSIWGKINTLRFDAKGFQPFINIADVGTLTLDEHKEKNIDWVLFFTDSLFVPSPSSLDPKEYGTLLDWWKEDIKIGIVTISENDCNKWQATEVVQCQALGESPDATTIKNMLSNFSQYFGRE